MIGAWVEFNWMLEARNWVKDSCSPETISHIPEEKVESASAALEPRINGEIESNKVN